MACNLSWGPLHGADEFDGLLRELHFITVDVSTLHEEISGISDCVQEMSQENEGTLRNLVSRFRSEIQMLNREVKKIVEQQKSLTRTFEVDSCAESLKFDDMNAIIAVCSEGADNVAVPYPPASFSGDTAPSYGGGAVPSFGGGAAPSFGGGTAPSFGGGTAPSFGGGAAPSFCSGAAPVPAPVVDTSLWTAIKQTSLAQYLSSRFDTNFGEHANVNGKLSAIQGGDSEAQVRFYVSPSLVVKAYMNVLESNAEKHLARGLHEIAATAFVCDKKGWKCEVFGVRIDGITHICLLRARLKSKPLTADEASTAFVDVLETTEVAHGDTHPENVLEDASGGFEVLDCERSFLIDKKLKAEIASTIRIYAHEPLKRPDLLNVIRKQGLEATRHRFILLARKFLNSHRDIFDLGIDELFATFENKN